MFSELDFRKDLLAWYDREQRQLPWRGPANPYATLVSELMLQQTQVKTVIPYFERFLERFPTPKELAEAEEQEVLKLWQGLGYYRRARYLQAAAQRIQEHHNGDFPGDKEAIDALPGVGAYTAAAVASIGFNLPHAVVDGNVIRVLSRLFALEDDVAATAVKRDIQARAQKLLDTERPGDYNQALMELGATRCSPRNPSCLTCPVSNYCSVRRKGLDPHVFPYKSKKIKPGKIAYRSLFLTTPGRFLLGQRPGSGLMASMWELPAQEETAFRDWRHWFADAITPIGRLEQPILHRFTHLHATYHIELYRVEKEPQWREGAPNSYQDFCWVDQETLGKMPLTKVLQKAIPAVGNFFKQENTSCPNTKSRLPGL
ncbi:A/G-specific adenine glycosylase [Acanthopleuribacter pedis]|uniref:Adenine DNA glycosylase n=1 Tax=Acanthopleuribacter pedis TaxID=442870 RepID=A0A8J7U5H2_9BACT|nr:A/G-specific adenine glycosylase [Acanthopleuribacter pedis]MBO1320849.1 A/G-specific adenine glycosylase [Acanthopleuribacter pedis]